jgi:hypothetical protein
MSFFEVMSEVQKDPEDVSAGIGKKKCEVLIKFSCNLGSKSARSTLTSPGSIRVKTFFEEFMFIEGGVRIDLPHIDSG